MKDSLDKVSRNIELREKQLEFDFRELFKMFGISFSTDKSKVIKDIITHIVILREDKWKEYKLLFNDANSIKMRYYRFLEKIRRPFTKFRHWLSGLFNRDCLCSDCIQKSLEDRDCGMKKYMNSELN